MGTILESVNNLSEKLGVEEREQTIKDQLDLCVERLGGEGYSKDIAESADKFADKEDGTATFTTKSITENGTYAASDDGVSGYSSVTVDVAGGASYPYSGIAVPSSMVPSQAASTYGMSIYNPIDGDGNYKVAGTPGGIYALQPLKSCTFYPFSGITIPIYFTPTDDFDGFYYTENPVTGEIVKLTVDDSRAAIVPGDGHLYRATVDTTTVTVYEKSSNSVIIE